MVTAKIHDQWGKAGAGGPAETSDQMKKAGLFFVCHPAGLQLSRVSQNIPKLTGLETTLSYFNKSCYFNF